MSTLRRYLNSLFFGSGAIVIGIAVVIAVKGVVSLFSYPVLFYTLLIGCSFIIASGIGLHLTKGVIDESTTEDRS